MSTSTFQAAFARLRKRTAAVRLGRAAFVAILGAIATVFVAIWLDLILILPAKLRVLANILAVLVAGAVWVMAFVELRRILRERALAQRLDRVGGTGGQILSGVDLVRQRRDFSGVGAGLASIAVDRAADLASSIAPARVVTSRPFRQAGIALFATIGGLAILAALMPQLARTEWVRFIDPHGDHPPFSRTSFDVHPGDTRVVFGQGFDVTARVIGPPVERLELVLEQNGAREEQVLPMFPELDGQWRATLSQITLPGKYHVRAHRARSPRQRIDVITVPQIRSVRFRIEPPAYTRQAVYEGGLPDAGITGLPGTRVSVWAESNRPLSANKAELFWNDKPVEPLALTPVVAQPDQVSASFRIVAEGKLRLRVRDVDGQLSSDEFTAGIHLREDQKPFVQLRQPESVSLATPSATLPVVVTADDDFGVSRLQLYRSLNDSQPLPANVPTPTSQPAHVEETVNLPLAQYGLRPGDTIKLFARVEDNDPAGAKGAESAISVVRIVSQEEFEQMVQMRLGIEVLMSKYAQADRRMEAIAEQIEKLQQQLATQPADSPMAAETRRQIEELAKTMEQEAQEIAESSKADLPLELDKALKERLAESAERLKDAAKQARSLATRPATSGQAGKELQGIAAQCRGGREKFNEEAMKPLDKLAKAYALMEDQGRFVQLYEQQQSLAERLAALKGQAGQDHPELRARFRDLEQEQQRIRNDVEQLVDDIESHLAQLPKDKEFDGLRQTATKFAEEFRKAGVPDVQRQAESHLAALEGTPSHASALEAAEIMNRFISRCSGMKGEGQACLKFQPNLGSQMAATAEQLLQQAGMGTGARPGVGSGGGYSAQRSTLANVGLYGRLPAIGAVSAAGGKEARRGGGRAGESAHREGGGQPLHQLSAAQRTSAAADVVIPPAYRERVGQYFERLAEELDRKPAR